MDRDVIKALIEALEASDLVELEYQSNGETLRLVKRGAKAAAPRALPAPVAGETPLAPPPPARPAAAVPETIPDQADRTIIAPLYGIIHLQQTPGAPPFVSPGQCVAAGQVVCIIEAMKVLNHIRAERNGVIAAVLVESGQEVEAGQTLFRLS